MRSARRSGKAWLSSHLPGSGTFGLTGGDIFPLSPAYTLLMPRQLLHEALEQARQSSASVRAMALLHIARVMTALDRVEAKRTLDQALEEIDALPATEREPAMNDMGSRIGRGAPGEG